MFYSHQPSYANIKHPQPKMTLPSFNELLTSIPLPNEFKKSNPSVQMTPPVLAHPSASYLSFSPVSVSSAPSPVHNRTVSIVSSIPTVMTPNTLARSVSPLDHGLPTPPCGSSSHGCAVNSILNCKMEAGFVKMPSENIQGAGPSPAVASKRKHVCKTCSRSFTTSGHLARHNRIHTGERKHICPWPVCGARFARQDNCMQHYKTHTNGKNKRRAASK